MEETWALVWWGRGHLGLQGELGAGAPGRWALWLGRPGAGRQGHLCCSSRTRSSRSRASGRICSS